MAGKRIEKIDMAKVSDRAVVVLTNTGQSVFTTEEGDIVQGKSYQVSGKVAKLLAGYPGINIMSVDGKEAVEARDKSLRELNEKMDQLKDAEETLKVAQDDLKAGQDALANGQTSLAEGQKALKEGQDQLETERAQLSKEKEAFTAQRTELCAVLGMGPEATDEDIKAAIAKAQESLDEKKGD